MSDRTTLLFALPAFRVLEVSLEPGGGRRVLVESLATEGGCPTCGVLSGRIKDRPTSRIRDLPHGQVPLQVWVRKRRFLCAEKACARRSFTETSGQLPARSRLTTRLRTRISAAVSTTNRAMSEVGKDYGVAWWTVHRVLVAAAVDVLGPAEPTTTIGIDETRARSVRETLGSGFPAQRFAWAGVEQPRDVGEVVRAVLTQVAALGQELAEQPVGVLVRPALPRAGRVAEVERHVGGEGEVAVARRLAALVPGQASAQLLRQVAHRGNQAVAHGLAAVIER